MFLISTRKRNSNKSFGHKRLPKGEYEVYEIFKSSDGKDAQQRTLNAIPTDRDILLLIHGFNNDFDQVTGAYLNFARKIRPVGFDGTVIGFNTLGHKKAHGVYYSVSVPQVQAEVKEHVPGAVWK